MMEEQPSAASPANYRQLYFSDRRARVAGHLTCLPIWTIGKEPALRVARVRSPTPTMVVQRIADDTVVQ